MPDTTVAPRIDTEAQDRGSPPGNGSDTRGSQDDVISPVLDRADDEEGILLITKTAMSPPYKIQLAHPHLRVMMLPKLPMV
jgi:hypothetical protein